jgi:hypothetical protein
MSYLKEAIKSYAGSTKSCWLCAHRSYSCLSSIHCFTAVVPCILWLSKRREYLIDHDGLCSACFDLPSIMATVVLPPGVQVCIEGICACFDSPSIMAAVVLPPGVRRRTGGRFVRLCCLEYWHSSWCRASMWFSTCACTFLPGINPSMDA